MATPVDSLPEITTLDGGSLIGVEDSGGAAKKMTVATLSAHARGGFANVVDYGGVGDNSTLNDSAFTAAVATGLPLYVPHGAFRISTSIIITDNRQVWMDGTVVQTVAGQPCITIGQTNAVTQYTGQTNKLRVRTTFRDSTLANNAETGSAKLMNCATARWIVDAQWCWAGLLCDGHNGLMNGYNTYDIASVEECRYGVYIRMDSNAWWNGNRLTIGKSRISSNSFLGLSAATVYSTHPNSTNDISRCNGNVVDILSVELTPASTEFRVPLDVEQFYDNDIYLRRTEVTTDWAMHCRGPLNGRNRFWYNRVAQQADVHVSWDTAYNSLVPAAYLLPRNGAYFTTLYDSGPMPDICTPNASGAISSGLMLKSVFGGGMGPTGGVTSIDNTSVTTSTNGFVISVALDGPSPVVRVKVRCPSGDGGRITFICYDATDTHIDETTGQVCTYGTWRNDWFEGGWGSPASLTGENQAVEAQFISNDPAGAMTIPKSVSIVVGGGGSDTYDIENITVEATEGCALRKVVGASDTLLAQVAARKDHRTAATDPASAGDTRRWEAGTVIYNSAPSTHAGWICTTSGSPGTWAAWGAI